MSILNFLCVIYCGFWIFVVFCFINKFYIVSCICFCHEMLLKDLGFKLSLVLDLHNAVKSPLMCLVFS